MALTSLFADDKNPEDEITQMLACGNQRGAEAKIAELLKDDPLNPEMLFLGSVLARSLFHVHGAEHGFFSNIENRPDSPEGLASACILGIDLSRDQSSAIYYFNALLSLSRQNPDSIPIHWMAAVMARTLTASEKFSPRSDVRNQIMVCGVREYETVLSLMAPGTGPVLVHQTMANLLDDLDAYDLAWGHRMAALRFARTPWSLQGAASTLNSLNRSEEALFPAQEAIKMGANDANAFETLGFTLACLDRKTEAIDEYDKVCKLAPQDHKYPKICAMLCKDLGNYGSARQYTRKGLAIDSGNIFFKVWDARFAALLGEPDASKRVLEAGALDFNGHHADLKPPSDPWFLAAQTGDFDKVDQLMGSAEIDARDPEDTHKTALMMAACSGWETIAAELIKKGAMLDEVDDNGDTALHYSAQFTNPRVMRLLLDAGANTDLQDKWKQTPLMMCASMYDREGFEMLVEKNANLNIANSRGAALHYAACHGQIAMVNALIKHGANVNITDPAGVTPLMGACGEYPHSFIVTPLLAAGADMKARDKKGRTALHYAVNPLMNIPLVELLLEKGADPTQGDNNGITPITQARLLGFEEIAKTMEKKSNRSEPFHFPQLPSPDSSLSPEEQKASIFVLPILLAHGHPPGWTGGSAAGDKAAAVAARKELSSMFGIHNTKDLQGKMDELRMFVPDCRDDAGDLPLRLPFPQINAMIKTAAQKIHASSGMGSSDETAWNTTQIIYLADLGICAGYLSKEEGTKLIAAKSTDLSMSFSSWPQFLKSLALGAEIYDGWEAGRYQHICQLILGAGLPWPSPGMTGPGGK